MGSPQLWKGCPFVAMLNVPGQPSQSARFLFAFSSAIIGGRSVIDPSHQELATGAVFVIGMPQRLACKEGDGKLPRAGAAGNLVEVGAACEW